MCMSIDKFNCVFLTKPIDKKVYVNFVKSIDKLKCVEIVKIL